MADLPVAPEGGCKLCPLGQGQGGKSNCIGARPALYGTRTLRQHREAKQDWLPPQRKRGRCRYLLVGEALGKVEDEAGVAWIGPAGQYGDRVLEVLSDQGLDLRDVWLTNAIRCRPPENRDPHMPEKRACRTWLDQEIAALQPEFIIALGRHAWSALKDEANVAVGRDRLKRLEYLPLDGGAAQDGHAAEMAVTFHPAAALRDRTKTRPIYEDLHAFLIEGVQHRAPEKRPQVWTIATVSAMQGVLDTLAKADRVAIDIETVGFSPKLLTVALSFSPYRRAYVLPVHHPESALPPEPIMGALGAMLARDDLMVIGQHVKYDLGRIRWALGDGAAIRCLADDSMSFHFMLDEHAPNRTLDYYSRRYTGVGGYKDQIDKGNLINEPLERVARYNGTDAAIVPGIIKQFESELRSFGYHSPQSIELYRRMVPFAACLEANGMHINTDALAEADRIHSGRVVRARRELQRFCGKDLNLNSWQQLGRYIYDELGLKLPKVKGAKTPTGGRSTSEPVIRHLAGEHPFIDQLIKHRSAVKMKGAYVDAISKHLWPDGLLHPNYFVVRTPFGQQEDEEGGGAVSGRFSAKSPAVQTIPKTDIVRGCFASRYGARGRLATLDGAQKELRYAGWVAGDEAIRAACESGDPHLAVAKMISRPRHIGKKVVFASIYQVTVPGLVQQAGLPLEVAEDIVPRLRKAWRTLYDYLDKVGEDAVEFGQVSVPYGAFRRVPGADPNTKAGKHLILSARNYVIQRPASDLTQLLGWRLMLELDGIAQPITSTHDSITFDIPPGQMRKSASIMRQVVAEQWKVDVKDVLGMDLGDFPFAFDLSVGHSWLKPRHRCSFRA